MSRSGFLQQVSRSVFWNTALLPLVTTTGLLLSIVVRRGFQLESGVYDAVLGIANSILLYSSLGLAGSLPKFLPELQVRAGRAAASALMWRLATVRIAVLVAILVPLNLLAEPIAQMLNLPDGATHLRLLTALLAGRAALDVLYRALDSFFQQLSVNLLSLVNGALDVVLAGMAIWQGLGVAGVIGALGVSSLVTAALAFAVVRAQLRSLPGGGDAASIPSVSRLWKLSGVTYLRDLSLYFATPAFASPVLLTALGGPAPVALFATSYFVAASTVALVVSGFRGVYRPAFARVLAGGDVGQLHRAFDLMNKVQLLAVVPAGFGLAVMVGDYLPLLYGDSFAAAVPLARTLVVLLFAETALAVAVLVLWADERYGPVLTAHAVMIAGAPVFVWTAGRFGLLPAAIVLGGSRLAASIIGCLEARRRYGVGYPWMFAGKVVLASSVMACTLAVLRQWWRTSFLEATTLTLLGVVIVFVMLRAFRVLGASEIDVIARAGIPGRAWLIRWMANPAIDREGTGSAAARRDRREDRSGSTR